MGNCAPKPKRSSPPPRRSSSPVPATMTFQLFGSESCPIAARIRISLLYKYSTFQFIPSESPILHHPVLRCGSQSISGSADMILRYIDSTFPGPPSPAENGTDRSSVAAELRNAVGLQHRSIEQHLEGVSRWAEEIASGGGGGRIAAGRRYAELVEIMLEHAQMEERFLFPLLEKAAEDRGLCGVAYGKHAKELPMMNGIKEDMKSVIAMGPKAPCYQEAMLNLSQRLKTLQEHCKEHFQKEERELLPLLNTAESIGKEEGEETERWLDKVMELMEVTHSQLFPFFMSGLLPHESMKYIELLCKSIKDQQQLLLLLKSLITSLERER
ncbi:uncharacterized protein LOC120280902 isoform X1 [Dioscorea cayenensis subsp. rotundata]|uniref:Uncharacterized protein LOC120280902 isoform X1 n=2 Tax=Dioscorea cayennensis subsp. rotundata TaxID=55577 RepID=A0AB40CWQ8_DIOCR|nr:uncharacterized protein LOC120280902 isoform X1 [Dioscorea cayenensis subsp. rotundata]